MDDLPKGELPDHIATYFTQKCVDDVSSAHAFDAQGFYALEILNTVDSAHLEKARKNGAKLFSLCKAEKIEAAHFVNISAEDTLALALSEGFMLSNYSFDTHKSKKSTFTMSNAEVSFTGKGSEEFENIKIGVDSVHIARNMVNEPVSALNAQTIAEEFTRLGKEAGFSVEVWNEAKIESQKFGGLLAVNKGSQEPPTFSIMEYKPKNALNKKPYVLVGKGVVFDTGG